MSNKKIDTNHQRSMEGLTRTSPHAPTSNFKICPLCGRKFQLHMEICVADMDDCHRTECDGSCEDTRFRRAATHGNQIYCPFCSYDEEKMVHTRCNARKIKNPNINSRQLESKGWTAEQHQHIHRFAEYGTIPDEDDHDVNMATNTRQWKIQGQTFQEIRKHSINNGGRFIRAREYEWFRRIGKLIRNDKYKPVIKFRRYRSTGKRGKVGRGCVHPWESMGWQLWPSVEMLISLSDRIYWLKNSYWLLPHPPGMELDVSRHKVCWLKISWLLESRVRPFTVNTMFRNLHNTPLNFEPMIKVYNWFIDGKPYTTGADPKDIQLQKRSPGSKSKKYWHDTSLNHWEAFKVDQDLPISYNSLFGFPRMIPNADFLNDDNLSSFKNDGIKPPKIQYNKIALDFGGTDKKRLTIRAGFTIITNNDNESYHHFTPAKRDGEWVKTADFNDKKRYTNRYWIRQPYYELKADGWKPIKTERLPGYISSPIKKQTKGIKNPYKNIGRSTVPGGLSLITVANSFIKNPYPPMVVTDRIGYDKNKWLRWYHKDKWMKMGSMDWDVEDRNIYKWTVSKDYNEWLELPATKKQL